MKNTVQEIIGDNREPIAVDSHLSLQKTIEYMRLKDSSAVAVCDENSVVGVFTEKDILRRVALEGLNLSEVAVSDMMSSPAYWISIDERCDVAKAIMVKKRLGHLVVLDKKGSFLGFISWLELLESDLASSQDLVGKLNDEYFAHNVDVTP